MTGSKLSRHRGRKGEARRRDSGYSATSTQPHLNTKTEPANADAEGRDSGDSGVGSPSPAGERAWGRRAAWREETRLLASTRAAAEQLANIHGGELLLLYRPRAHPNLPGLHPNQTRLFFPKKPWEQAQPDSEDRPIPPGHFFAKSGLTEADILEQRLPELAGGVQAAISNGLSLDLLRMVDANAALGSRVVQFIFSFLELTFPESLLEAAVSQTLACLEENRRYVADCELREATTFLYAPFELPSDVIEMAAVQECWQPEEQEEEEFEYVGSIPVGEYSSLEMSTEEAMVLPCSVSLQEQHSIDMDILQEAGPTAPELQRMECLPEPMYTEDENFCYTATVLNLDPASLSQLMGPALGQSWPLSSDLNTLSDKPSTTEANSGSNSSEPPSAKKSERSRTRTVQIPSRYKDFSTLAFTAKKTKLECS